MPEKPLLIFPQPTDSERYKRSINPPDRLNKPSRSEQISRIEPQFQQLEAAFRSRRLQLQTDIAGAEPEMALVFETRCTINEFFKALKDLPDLEWLGEIEQDFRSNTLFYINDSNKDVKGRVFFIMSNYRGLRQLKSLWDNYYKTGAVFKRGTTKWRDLFDLLHDIRPWGLQDRIQETGLIEDWRYRLSNGAGRIPFEIELWYRSSRGKRAQVKGEILELLRSVDGNLLQESIIEDIAYHALLIEAPISIFNDLTENTNVEFLKASDVMYLRPVGQCAVKVGLSKEVEEQLLPSALPMPIFPPVVALFDGMPVQNHGYLAGRISVDDPDSFQENYPVQQREHGTAMASLIIHGDLTSNETPLQSTLYVRPIMKFFQGFREGYERIPETVLVVDLIHRAVRRLFEGEGTIPAVAPTVRVINLSIGDPSRIFDNIISPFAKVIDWLSFKYNVLFIISAGNCSDSIELSIPRSELYTLLSNNAETSKAVIAHIYNNIRFKKIIAPAESMNALCVGAAHDDSCNGYNPGRRINLFTQDNFFSPASRFGLGFGRSIKPDVLVSGGRLLFDEKLGTAHEFATLHISRNRSAPGHKTAAPSPIASFNATTYLRGTSNAAALLSRTAAKLHEVFSQTDDLSRRVNITEYFAVIAKSLLVHSSSWHPASNELLLSALPDFNGNGKDLISRFFGYGIVKPERIIECTDKRVTLVGYGRLNAEDAHLYKLPLPVGLSGKVAWRSLTVTLAWITPINPSNQIYKKAKIWFDFPNNDLQSTLKIARKFYDDDTVKRGTVQHEIFDGRKAVAFIEGTHLEIRVNCKEEASKLDERVKYALSVTLEIDDSIDIDIYNEVRSQIQQMVST